MNTKQAIYFLENNVEDLGMPTPVANERIKDVINLLRCGEKYEQIVKDIKHELEWHKPEVPLFTAKLGASKDEEFLNEILDLIDGIKQKYFPVKDYKLWKQIK